MYCDKLNINSESSVIIILVNRGKYFSFFLSLILQSFYDELKIR
jgi:hypothetical protein